MALNQDLKLIKCVMDNTLLVQKSHVEDFDTQSQLIVNESQEALFYKEGQALDLFGPGRHALTTENVPLFKKFFSRLLDAKTPFPCEVFFINRVSVLDMLWGTPSAIVVEDPQYGIVVSVRGSGQTGLRVKDSRKFVVKVVGQLPTFSVETVRRQIKTMMMTTLSTLIAETIVKHRVGILEIATKLEELSEAVQIKLNEKLDEIGLETVLFNIGTIFAEEKDLAKLRAAKEKALEIELLAGARAKARAAEGYTYQEERRADILQTAAANTGTAGNIIGAGLGLGMGLGVMQDVRRETKETLAADAAKSCPFCGGGIGPGAKFCPECGKSIPQEKRCPNCGIAVDANAKFCHSCGTSLAPTKKFCPECGNELESSARFCSTCGHKF